MTGAAVGMNKPPDFKRWMRAWDPQAASNRTMTPEEIESVFDGMVRSSAPRQ